MTATADATPRRPKILGLRHLETPLPKPVFVPSPYTSCDLCFLLHRLQCFASSSTESPSTTYTRFSTTPKMTVIGEPWTFKRSGLTAPTRTLKSAMVSKSRSCCWGGRRKADPAYGSSRQDRASLHFRPGQPRRAWEADSRVHQALRGVGKGGFCLPISAGTHL